MKRRLLYISVLSGLSLGLASTALADTVYVDAWAKQTISNITSSSGVNCHSPSGGASPYWQCDNYNPESQSITVTANGITKTISAPVPIPSKAANAPASYDEPNHTVGLKSFTGGSAQPTSNDSINMRTYMSWPDTAPQPTKSQYISSDAWEKADALPVINYSPSHYPYFDQSGTIGYPAHNGVGFKAQGDTSFQNNIATDLPKHNSGHINGYVNYLLGNPQIRIYNDLKQLKASGFNAVRLYGEPASSYIATIKAANKLGMKVYYEVAVPDLSDGDYLDANGQFKSVAERENILYQALTQQADRQNGIPEGSLQSLHYVIHAVTPKVFSNTVVMVYFGHEDLVSPKQKQGTMTNTKLTDDNTSTPLLVWGVQAVRDLLSQELKDQQAVPAVTVPLLAGQIVQVSENVQPEVKTLIDVIQKDPNAPVAYDAYPFQWNNKHYYIVHNYVNGQRDPSGQPYTIKNAYPNSGVCYNDMPFTHGLLWVDSDDSAHNPAQFGVPQPFFTSDIANNPAQLGRYAYKQPLNPADSGPWNYSRCVKFSLPWTVDRVNWIWGYLQKGVESRTTKQIIAETGWPDQGNYQHDTSQVIKGNANQSYAYFRALQHHNFKVGNAVVSYFDAYDEPLKQDGTQSPNMTSENHYGIFRWSGLAKENRNGTPLPGLDAGDKALQGNFAIVSLVPLNNASGMAALRSGDTRADQMRYQYSIDDGNTSAVKVPYYAGLTASSNSSESFMTNFVANPDVLLKQGDSLSINSPLSGSSAKITVNLSNTDPSANVGCSTTPVPDAPGSFCLLSDDQGDSYKLTLNTPFIEGPSAGQLVTGANWWGK